MPVSLQEKRNQFRKLHASGSFILPNAWDAGGARILQGMGFKALATTSAGYAASIGCDDLSLSMEATLENLRTLSDSTDLPVNADFESGFAVSPEELAENVTLAVQTGISGLSIEDRDGDHLFDIQLSSDRIKAARAAIDKIDPNIVLVGRSEGFLVGQSDIDDTIERLVAYANAGADVLYAPGVSQETHIRAIVEAVKPKPVNVLLISPEMSAINLKEIGVGRISVGGFLATAAWHGFTTAAQQLLNEGTLTAGSF
ncbi:isocitrate lyase/PEP mutase family protein [Endozoicomonas arenosclerae]|uniref:isocitrate lyase/PEP mutase family protein n=1 Tax=Endozoicomonas arenosclerae TaxID=1633495 RepID=UPI0007843ADD|nr:isocitrate lyase/phosphoenolpyruvate mutase family protein [Endozoicomonas arenosclerae]